MRQSSQLVLLIELRLFGAARHRKMLSLGAGRLLACGKDFRQI